MVCSPLIYDYWTHCLNIVCWHLIPAYSRSVCCFSYTIPSNQVVEYFGVWYSHGLAFFFVVSVGAEPNYFHLLQLYCIAPWAKNKTIAHLLFYFFLLHNWWLRSCRALWFNWNALFPKIRQKMNWYAKQFGTIFFNSTVTHSFNRG